MNLKFEIAYANGPLATDSPPPEIRPEEWQRYYAEVDWYLAGLLAFWAQLYVWCFVRPAIEKRFIIGFFAALVLTGFLFLIVALVRTTDSMFP